MSEFFEVHSPSIAISKITSNKEFPSLRMGLIKTINSLDRIIAEDIISDIDLPHFDRSSMDGYAIRSQDSNGVSESSPNYIKVIEEIKMGNQPSKSIKSGEASRIFTGGMLPKGADSIIMEEDTEELSDNFIEIKKSISIGENIIYKGEEIKKNKIIISNGKKIRSQEIGSLLESGITQIKVYKQLNIGVLSSGDELINPHENITPGKIRDINTYTISNLIMKTGSNVKNYPIMPDDFNKQLIQSKKAYKECDILIFSAGSSISYRDTTAKVIKNLGTPGIIIHGISVKPGKPTILGLCDKKIIIGLPGNPVSAVMIFINIVQPIIEQLYNHKSLKPYLNCILDEDISSKTGRVDYVPVKIITKDNKLFASPVLGKSNLINTLVQSDGYVVVPSEKRGLYKHTNVKINLYE